MNKQTKLRLSLIIPFLCFFASCTFFDPAIRNPSTEDMPETYSLYTANTQDTDPWWESFQSPDLNLLIEEALSGSLTLKQAWARLRQSKAQAARVEAGLYPDLNATGGFSFSKQKTRNGQRDTSDSDQYSVGFISSYELDLWGRIRSESQAEVFEARATREDWSAAAMSLTAEIASIWTRIISQRMQKILLEKQMETNRSYLELVKLRFQNGLVSALDIYQQQQIVEGVKAEIPLVETQEELYHHQLALLLGKPPGVRFDIRRKILPDPPKVPPGGIPADLLANRPDVRAAGLRLQAADWQLAAARADRLPALSFNATARYGPAELDLLMDNWLLNLAGNLTAPLFDAKQRTEEVNRVRAVVDETLLAYRETVWTAIKDVEDALVSETGQRQHLQVLKTQIETARKALDEARERYRKGLNDYLSVLTQLVSVQNLERDLIQKQTDMILYRISLYRALGGTWTERLVPEPDPAPNENKRTAS